jgi:membrane-associated protease RseP (regulator of RpoE activity)
MFHRSSGVVENGLPRLWSLGIAAGLLSLTALVVGLGPHAAPARADEPAKKEDGKKEEPKKEEPKKEEPKKEEPKSDFPEIDLLFKNLPPGIDPDQIKQMRDQMKRTMEQMRKQFPNGPLPPIVMPAMPVGGFAGDARRFNPFGIDQNDDGRLGARVKEPSATLVDQLDLPRGQGMVIEEVTTGSAAAKAGFKPNDILLELGGKPVANNLADAVKMIDGLKADTPLDAVVLRKGKKETIKGVSLPEAKKAEAPAFPGFAPGAIPVPAFPGGAGGFGGLAPLPPLPGMPGFPGLGGAGGVMTTVFRSGDRFTARHQEGNLVVTVTGTVADGKASTKTINVQDGAKTEKYESIDKVPEEYRDKVKNLVEMGEKGAAKVEIK